MTLPDVIFNQHIVALGKTGAGKSYTLRGLVERLLEDGKRVCIVDPKGDWWGLKSSASGKSAGFPVVIFGGDHADVPLNAHVGGQVAELVATGNRPCILDFGGWMVGERTRFWIDFAHGLFKHNRGPLWVVIDEVHNFAPQGKIQDPDAGKCLHWTNRLASEGRGKGITILMASQRPQKVHKDTLTCAETLIAMRVLHPLDRGAVKEWIDGCGNAEQGKQVLNDLAQMKVGEGWVWSPEIGFLERVKFPTIKTFDSFAAPTITGAAAPKGWAEVDLDDVKKTLSAVVEQAKANDPGELKKQIAALKKEKSELEKSRPQKQTKSTTDPRLRKALETAMKFIIEVKTHNFDPGAQPETIKAAIDSAVAAAMKQIGQKVEARNRDMARWQGAASQCLSKIDALMKDDKIEIGVAVKHNEPFDVSTMPHRSAGVRSASAAKNAPRKIESNGEAFNGRLPIGERKILEALIQYPEGLERSQLTVLTGYKRSSRDAYISRLREKDLVAVSVDRVEATPEGIAALPDAQPLPIGVDLQQFHLGRLPQGERALLEILIGAYPESVAKDTLTERTGYMRSSRDAYLARMRAKQIITEPSRGEARASDTLFDT